MMLSPSRNHILSYTGRHKVSNCDCPLSHHATLNFGQLDSDPQRIAESHLHTHVDQNLPRLGLDFIYGPIYACALFPVFF